MKQWIFSIVLLILIQPAFGEMPLKEYKKEIRKEYSMNPEGLVGVTNKYGKVEVHSWEKNEASFQVVITVVASNTEKADEVFERISINFAHSMQEVRAETVIEDKPKSVWSWWWSSGSSSEFTIDYVVYIPRRAELDVNNKYGDVLIDQLANRANIDLKYGNLHLAGSSDKVDFQLGYSKAKIGDTEELTGEVKYSTLKSNRTGNLRCESKYSKVEVEEAQDMMIVSKYDTYVIGRARSIENEGKYDDFEIREIYDLRTSTAYTDWKVQLLKRMADVDMKYGELKIYEVSPACEKINFKGSYASLRVDVDAFSEYKVNIKAQYGDVNVPEGFTVIEKEQEGSDLYMAGYYRNPNAKMVLYADIKYGGVSIR